MLRKQKLACLTCIFFIVCYNSIEDRKGDKMKIQKIDCLIKARKIAKRCGGFTIDYYYKLLTKYKLW